MYWIAGRRLPRVTQQSMIGGLGDRVAAREGSERTQSIEGAHLVSESVMGACKPVADRLQEPGLIVIGTQPL